MTNLPQQTRPKGVVVPRCQARIGREVGSAVAQDARQPLHRPAGRRARGGRQEAASAASATAAAAAAAVLDSSRRSCGRGSGARCCRVRRQRSVRGVPGRWGRQLQHVSDAAHMHRLHKCIILQLCLLYKYARLAPSAPGCRQSRGECFVCTAAPLTWETLQTMRIWPGTRCCLLRCACLANSSTRRPGGTQGFGGTWRAEGLGFMV